MLPPRGTPLPKRNALHRVRRSLILALIAAAALSAVVPTTATAQSLAGIARPPVDGQVTAESFVREYMAAVRKGHWSGLTRFYHPEALAQFRASVTTFLESSDSRAGEARAVLAGADSVASLRAMSDADLFSAFATRIFPKLPKEALDMVFKPIGEVIGSVPDRLGVTHVVYRTRMAVLDKVVNTTDVISAKRTATGWGVMLNREFVMLTIFIASAQK